MSMLEKVKVAPGPHIKNPEGTSAIMGDVIIALIPALVMAVINFGFRATTIVLACVLSCVVFEALYNIITRTPHRLTDLSAVVTGIILAFNLPVAVPIWLCVVGSFFAIIVVKMLFGGIGKNFMNPAMASRVFLLLSFGSLMTVWAVPGASLPLATDIVDVVTSATPLTVLKEGKVPVVPLLDMFVGQIGGSLGETSALALIFGGLYLLYRKVITPIIPVTYIATVFVLFYAFPQGNDALTFASYQIFAGGLMLGAIFMATDYSSSPIKAGGQFIFAIGLGVITVVLRVFGSLPESVSYAIIIMNTLVPLIDKLSYGRRYGAVKKVKAKKEEQSNG